MEYTEDQIRHEALVELASSSNGELTTSELIDRLTKRLQPTGKDAEIINERSDTHFSQKVRNLVSHRNQGTGLETRGLAIYLQKIEGWSITDSGRTLVVKPA